MPRVVADDRAGVDLRSDLEGLAREGARRMLVAALEAEVDDYLAAHAAERDERGSGWWSGTAMPTNARC